MKTDTIILFGKHTHRDALARFKREYEMARGRGEPQFFFDGQEVLVTFAKYVLQYAEHELGEL